MIDRNVLFPNLSANLLSFATTGASILAIILVAVIIARLLRQRAVAGFRRAGVDANAATLVSNGVVVGVYAVALTLIISVLGGTWTAAVTILSAGTVALSLALQDVLRGFVAGVYLLLERPFVIGDQIKVRDVSGTVEAIELRTTHLRSDGSGIIVVPNTTVFSEIVTNRSVNYLLRTTATVSELPVSAPDPLPRTEEALAKVPGIVGVPRIDEVSTDQQGMKFAISVTHRPDSEIAALVAVRLRELFPGAGISVSRGPA